MSIETIIFLNSSIFLLGFLVLFALNNSSFRQNSGWISLIINILGIIFSSSLQSHLGEVWQYSYHWIQIGDFKLNYDWLLNDQTFFMHLLVQIIAVFVQIFSLKYMKSDAGINRFFAYINLFVFSMLGLILSGNLLQVYIFWELVGFCSYLLISFWYTKSSAASAALKAFFVNRIGDAFFFVGILFFYISFGSLNFLELTSESSLISFKIINTNIDLPTLAMLLIFVGVIAKSAQFPLQVWLPDAMEGPTPASALIHAATMVVAGVFLLARLGPLITFSAGLVIAVIGSFTSLIAGFSAVFQFDIKKVLAYSTISQLGFMISAIGIGAIGPALFHLTTHAFFKAGLFLVAGAVISYCHHEQDMRKMGNLVKKMPIIFIAYLICGGALIGLPFSSGYLSKESILNEAFYFGLSEGRFNWKIIIFVMLILSSFLTTFYVVRQIVMVFFERQENPVDKILTTTRKTFEGAFKSFQSLLTAEDEVKSEGSIISFFQNLGVYEIVLIFLSLASTWFVFSNSPFDYMYVWHIVNFKSNNKELAHFIPYLVSALSFLALLIAFNTTSEEIRKFYFTQKASGIQRTVFRLGYHHFYIDFFYKYFFKSLLFGSSNEAKFKGLIFTFKRLESNGIDRLINEFVLGFFKLAMWAKKIEIGIIDRLVWSVTYGLKMLGDYIRRSQKGLVQNYLWAMLAIISLIILFKILMN